ncbi:MAG TPA: hypothetical protein VFP40_04105 [Terriglobales bacterium]|nr:hypothetical protein [Terriglobales bacterium]
MNWHSWMLWGFISTLLMTTMEAGAQAVGLTRIDFPFMVGTIFTTDRDRAKIYGFLAHVLNGWAFSLLYVLAFEAWHQANWWRGALIGAVHALFVLLVVMSIMPGIHPRMASEQHGPTAARQLEPPGFLGLNYGVQTPLSIFLAHIVFGAVLGAFYHLS